MKNKILSSLLFFILGTNLMSCNKDTESYNPANIVGEWEMVAIEGYEEYGKEKDEWNSTIKDSDWDYLTFTFEEDGTGNDSDMNFNYFIVNNIIHFTPNDYNDDHIWKIIFLSKTDLIITKSFSDEKIGHYFYTKMTFKKIN